MMQREDCAANRRSFFHVRRSFFHVHKQSHPVALAKNAECMAFASQVLCQHDLTRPGNKFLPTRDLDFGASTDRDHVPSYIRVMPPFKEARSNAHHVRLFHEDWL